MSDESTPDDHDGGAHADGDDADPFDDIDEGAGPRHGDPFESLADAGDDRRDDGGKDATGGDVTADDGPADDVTDDVSGGDDGPAELPEGADPFDALDAPDADPFAEGRTIFDRDPDDLDDGVWERMDRSDADAAAVPGTRHVDVDKHAYCEGCEYFSAPPDVACSHEGTEILEFVDVDTVRVVDCPVVAERKALEDVD